MVISRGKEFRIKHPRIHLTGTTFVIIFLILYLIGWSVFSIEKGTIEQKRERRLAEAVDFCESLFDESAVIKNSTLEAELKDCDERLKELDDSNERTELIKVELAEAYKYLDFKNIITEWFDENDIVKSSLDERGLTIIHEAAEKLSAPYQALVADKRNHLQSEYDKMREAENLVNNLFTSVDRSDVSPNAERGAYDNARNHVNELAQEDLKQSLSESLDKVLPVIEEKERIARERAEAARRAREEEQRKIRESWHNLDLNGYYINQLSNGLINGCEAASLLMAAKYKGYAGGIGYRSFADNMPKAENDDPNTGFVGAMDNNDGDLTHWIAPAPLAVYGQSSGINVTNISGSSLDQLDQEVANGNPVIIYLTYNFNSPRDYNNGVPRNLHVLVLAGYNSYTGEQVLYDPLPKYGNSHPTVSKSTVEWLYQASGRRALVVR